MSIMAFLLTSLTFIFRLFFLSYVAIFLILLPCDVFAFAEKKETNGRDTIAASAYIVIKQIDTKGNKKTKEYRYVMKLKVGRVHPYARVYSLS